MNSLKRNLSIVLVVLMFVQLLPINAVESVNETSEVNESSEVLDEVFDYVLFSGSENSPLNMNGSKIDIKGNIHTNNNFVYSGSKLNIGGICDAAGNVTIRGSKTNVDQINQKSQIIEMLDYTEDIVKTITVTDSVYDIYRFFMLTEAQSVLNHYLMSQLILKIKR